jgi:trans-aconitate methyltransferase
MSSRCCSTSTSQSFSFEMNRSHAQKITWDPEAYAANSSWQQTWGRELIARLELRGGERILDVGCGDGKVTAEIARAVPRGSATGVDTSPQMIEFAQKTFPPAKILNLKFQIMDATEIQPARFEDRGVALSPSPPPKEGVAGARSQLGRSTCPLTATLPPSGRGEGENAARWSGHRSIRPAEKFDLIFSNAALHWVDDHPAFLRGAAACLCSGGRLVVSCGGKGNAQDVFAALCAQMRLKRWREFFRKMEAPYFFHAPEEYEKWLPRLGFKTRSVRLADKDMVFDEREKFAGWFRTTWLPYTQRVPENLRAEFIAAVVERYVAKHPPDDKNRVHVRMVRLEIDAEKT